MINKRLIRRSVLAVCMCLIASLSTGGAWGAWANHHLMQIQQVMGGVNGDITAQAIQLRMRGPFQNQMQNSKLWVHDAAGGNSILLIDFTSAVANSNDGDTVLVVSSNFVNQTNPSCDADFILTNLIPESYMAAGSLTFENNSGTSIWWRLSWGGKSYTGPTTGSTTNDADGDFGVYPDPLPVAGLQAFLFEGAAGDLSTNNADDYGMSTGAAVYTNNAHSTFEVVGAGTLEVCPDAATILRGIVTEGELGNVCGSDDVKWSFQPDAIAATVIAPVNIELTGDASDAESVSELRFHLEAAATHNGVVLGIDLFNFNTGSFESAVFPNIPTTDTEFTVVKSTGAADFISGTGQVKARVRFLRPAGVPPFWNVGIDRAGWEIE